jgi:hypothetical protein
MGYRDSDKRPPGGLVKISDRGYRDGRWMLF